ncbi:membrane protein [Mycolicibacterium anyangense]|uniref:Membrane protein n=1 Tax=Mycolicibacterium anyangense TaxID=1431246 RepID=A0A6N4WD55_9MYCO|nr:MmpS family transport accessory protein [Mycolicibacterium anyangense]BBZ78695.1 membrane protein [Mycolicibacterium anyangense]
MGLLKRAWLPLVMVIVVVVGGIAVGRIRGIFGSDPVMVAPTNFAGDAKRFTPKVVRYEVFGPPGAVADVNYIDLDAMPQRASSVPLPWSLTLSTTDASVSATLVAQGNADELGCRVYVDEKLRVERTVDGYNAQTYCIVKSA